MGSVLKEAIRKKRENKREEAKQKREVIQAMRIESAYRAKLHEELNTIDALLQNDEIDSIEITVPEKHLSNFTKAIYSVDELAEYTINQISANQFEIGRRIINF